MTEPVWVREDALRAVHAAMIVKHGGVVGTRDDNLLTTALARPCNLYHYEDCFDINRLAAAYAGGITHIHPFADGNKRSAFMAAFIFLRRNRLNIIAEEAEVVTMTRALAAGSIAETDYADWIAANTQG